MVRTRLTSMGPETMLETKLECPIGIKTKRKIVLLWKRGLWALRKKIHGEEENSRQGSGRQFQLAEEVGRERESEAVCPEDFVGGFDATSATKRIVALVAMQTIGTGVGITA